MGSNLPRRLPIHGASGKVSPLTLFHHLHPRPPDEKQLPQASCPEEDHWTGLTKEGLLPGLQRGGRFKRGGGCRGHPVGHLVDRGKAPWGMGWEDSQEPDPSKEAMESLLLLGNCCSVPGDILPTQPLYTLYTELVVLVVPLEGLTSSSPLLPF